METLAYLHLTAPESTPSPARRPPRSTAPDSDFAQTRSLTLPGVIGAGLVGMATFAPLSAQAQASLSQGSSGPAVEELQEQLAALGYFDATATGYYGSITEEAVLRFQTDRGLFVDGVAGPATLEALLGDTDTDANEAIRSSLTTSEVSELQEQLADLGYFEATATGYYGTITEEAVRRFQADRGLVVDGVAGPATFEALVAKREQDLVASEPISPSPVVSEPAIPVNVDSVTADLQSDLASLGYYQGRVDGIYGPLTSSAIEAFKEDSGLPVNGLVSVDMLEALDQAITSQVSTVRLSDSTISVTPMYSTSTVSTSTSAELVSFVSRDTPSPSADTKQSTDKVIPKPADEIVVRQGSGSGSVVVQQRPERTIIEAVPSTSVFVTPPAETVLPGTTYATYPPAIPFGSTYSAPYSSGTESIYSTPDYDSTGATAYGYGGPTAPPAPPRYDASFYPYVVAIPYRSQEDLATVARFSPSAFVAGSQRGTYVNAGSYASRVEAESLTEALRQQGLDARVIFRPR